MSSATITLVNLADENQVYDLVGQTAAGASYKDTSRELSEPKTLTFQYKIGSVGSLGNDHLIVKLSNAVQNEDTGKLPNLTATLDVSVPRDAAITSADVVDMLCEMASLLSDARNANIADGIVP